MPLLSLADSNPTSRVQQIPDIIQHSPLYRRGGFELIDSLLEPSSLAQLQRESLALSSSASENTMLETDENALEINFGRGGSPARKFLSTQGRTVQDAFYHSNRLKTMLETLSQADIKPTGARGTYSYYARTDDFLALHRTILESGLAIKSWTVNRFAWRDCPTRSFTHQRRTNSDCRRAVF